MNWTEGRQGTGYYKKTIHSFNILGIEFDAHLIKYPKGSKVPSHIDGVHDKIHRRLNIIIKHAIRGGMFKKNNIKQTGRIHFFRPDVDRHEVTTVEEGERIVLSFGIAYFN